MAAVKSFIKISCYILLILHFNFDLIISEFNDEEFSGFFSIPVEHALSFDTEEFVERGYIQIRSVTDKLATYHSVNDLSDIDKVMFKKLAMENAIYRIRIPIDHIGSTSVSKTSNDYSSADQKYVSTFISACAIYESKLSDIITIHVDQIGNVIGLSLNALHSHCSTLDSVNPAQLDRFNTTVRIQSTVPGPTPDTQSYVQKIEKEKEDRAKGQQPDNRPFFVKYWMYIVPALIIFLVTTAEQPQQGGGNQ